MSQYSISIFILFSSISSSARSICFPILSTACLSCKTPICIQSSKVFHLFMLILKFLHNSLSLKFFLMVFIFSQNPVSNNSVIFCIFSLETKRYNTGGEEKKSFHDLYNFPIIEISFYCVRPLYLISSFSFFT